jgi:hypothetical protein
MAMATESKGARAMSENGTDINSLRKGFE